MRLLKYPYLGMIMLLAAAAQAQNEKTFSLTVSPFHLAMPVVELTGEYALAPKAGIAAIGGFGSYTGEGISGKKVDMPVLELGTQLNYYLVGTFRHGMQLGGELLWLKVTPPDEEGVTASANGIAVGPLIGYKWVARFGLTLFVQGGYEWLFAQAKAKNSAGEEVEGSVDDGIPLFNANIGWSF